VSVEIPKVAIAFGSVAPPQGDVIDLRVHLGCTKEVSSFEVLLQNWDKKYSPGGTSPITVGLDGHIDIGRGTNVPQIITCRVESAKYESTPTENYIRVSGRCWGEKLFRRVVTKEYESQKGEDIVKDLMDSYAGLSHVRDSTELVESTDTTFTHLEYENSPVWDILKYIAESSDIAGVIGYDFRVAPDGKFEFFPKNSKTSPISLTEKIEVSEYRKDIVRIRNKIKVYGIANKSIPADKDSWTENSLDGWSASQGHLYLQTYWQKVGSKFLGCYKDIPTEGYDLDFKKTHDSVSNPLKLIMWLTRDLYDVDSSNSYIRILAPDASNYFQVNWADLNVPNIAQGWGLNEIILSKENIYNASTNPNGKLHKVGSASLINIQGILFHKVSINTLTGTADFRVDGLYYDGCRYLAIREDTASQTAYGLRELTETDDELVSDTECDLRAKALLDYFKAPAEYLTVRSTVIDYGTTPILAGDKIHVTLPNENVDSDFRVESVEYRVDAKTQTLEITLELGKVPPLLADYLYGLRATTVTVEKLARTKLGKGTIPQMAGGGLGNHHTGHEAGDQTGAPWSENAGGWDKIIGWICPNYIGPVNDEAAIINFRTKNKAGTALLDHQFNPSDDQHGVFGNETKRWKEVHTLYLLLYTDGYMQIKTVGEANPKVRLSANMLQFGAGGASALDTWLKRIAANQFESSGDIIPDGDNVRSLGLGGATPKRWKEINVVNLSMSSHLIPGVDNTYDIGEGTTPKRWRDLYLAGAIKALGGGVAVHLLPNANSTYDLGNSAMKWSNLYVNGVGDLGWLNVGGFTVITSARVLQNVAAAAGIITSGRFPLARLPEGDSGKFLRAYGAGFDPMYALLAAGDIPSLDASKITSGRFPLARFPEGTAGYVLEAEGAGFDPMYVNPNGRYQPASHTHSHASLTGVGPNDHHAQVHNHAGEALSPDSIAVNTLSVAVSVNCTNWVHADITFQNDFRITEAEKLGFKKGLAFLNPKGKVLMMLDGEGNLHVAGKVKEGLPRKAKKGVAG